MTNDAILKALGKTPGPLGELAKAFPGRSGAHDDSRWIDDWFTMQASIFAAGKGVGSEKITSSKADPETLSALRKPPATKRVRLSSIQVNYLRGFRKNTESVAFDDDLVVVEGRNSSGKTSIAEALEWLFTGQLSRRTSGNSRELANCIGNEFRPNGEHTWVEAALSVDDEPLILRRVLIEDYSERGTSVTTSELYVGAEKVSPEEATRLMDDLFAGVPPILMQHTLGQFIHEDPDNRRRYFERLLQMDELTALIEKAVVGDARVADFAPQAGGLHFTRWKDLKTSLTGQARNFVDRFERKRDKATRSTLENVFVTVASFAFPSDVTEGTPLAAAIAQVGSAQTQAREKRFPFLNALRPSREQSGLGTLVDSLTAALETYKISAKAYSAAQEAAQNVSAAASAVARALEELVAEGLVDPGATKPTSCPVCEHPERTLTPKRIAEIRVQLPLVTALRTARESYHVAKTALASDLTSALTGATGAYPRPVPEKTLKAEVKGLDPAVVMSVSGVNSAANAMVKELEKTTTFIRDATTTLADSTPKQETEAIVKEACEALTRAVTMAMDYERHFADMEKSLGVVALDDQQYSVRDKWLEAAKELDGILQAIQWEHAKEQTQALLKKIRAGLIDLRAAIIEEARVEFSTRMTDVWRCLRTDTASSFSRLNIPEVRGKGFKLEMEVKAQLSDGATDVEVDALKVFSESQINVLGLAAYITRARLLGHALLIFDDPVQSMDEEHHLSFANTLTSSLIDEGFQVVVLTHSDQFARDVADSHYHRRSFATLKARNSKRVGVVIEEGSRRVAERLKRADHFADEGELDEAWVRVRLALERLYVLAYKVSHPEFDTRTWRKQTAEYMWDNGSGLAVENIVPGSGTRLRQILTMSAAGAHDSSARGVTDLKEATKFIRSLLTPLRIGDG
ncbi:MAG TPA: AAA family ATPase [Gemmatimonadaceae bacterium]|nr:AAA family ATPase [Gemmatimonadaceae bacterium]